jgi:1-acyl-sn-glycerol-3-phosphate acyltransferase
MSLPKPAGYVPPPPPALADVARTLGVAGTDLLGYLATLAISRDQPSTATAEGLAKIGARFARTLRRLGVAVEALHADRVPRAGGLVLMWNQESHIEHLALAATIPRPFYLLYNTAIARTPLYGEHLRRAGHVHLDRTDEAQWRAGIMRAAARAREGACMLVSPEGTRSWDGRLLPMKRGAFLLAEAAAQPIVCVTILGGHERLPRGSPFVRRGPLLVVFSEPILSSGETAERLSERVRATFAATKERYRVQLTARRAPTSV